MNIIHSINSLGSEFLDFAVPMLIQSSILIVILLVLDLFLKNKIRAIFRYCLWMLILVKLMLPTSLSSPLSPGYYLDLKVPTIATTQMSKDTIPESSASPKNIESNIANPSPAHPSPSVSRVKTSIPAAKTTIPPTQADTSYSNTTKKATDTSISWKGLVFLGWLAGMTTLLLLLLQRVIFVKGLITQAKKPNKLLGDNLAYCREKIQLRTRVSLKISANMTSPAVCGLIRPVILIPNNLAPSLGSSQLRTVLLHELAHIKRRDLWVNLAQTLLQIAYFYNPLVWVANAVIRRVREQAVDETVQAALGQKARQYPETLLNIAKIAFRKPALSLRLIGVVESKNALKTRIKRMLTRPIPKSAKLGIIGLLGIVIIAAVLLPMAFGKNENKNIDILTDFYNPKRGKAVEKLLEKVHSREITSTSAQAILKSITGRLEKHPKRENRTFVKFPKIFREELKLAGEIIRSGKVSDELSANFFQALEFVRCIYEYQTNQFEFGGELYAITPGVMVNYKLRLESVDGKSLKNELLNDVFVRGDRTIGWGGIGETDIHPEKQVQLKLHTVWYQIPVPLAKMLPGMWTKSKQTLDISRILEQASPKQICEYSQELKLSDKSDWSGSLRKHRDILQKKLQTLEQKSKIGRADYKELQQAKIDLLRVESKLAKTPQKRIDKLEQIAALYQDHEKRTQLLLDSGRASPDELDDVKLLRLEAEGELARAKAEAEGRQADFKANLTNGMKIELMGICEYPSAGKQWWRPDGTLFNPDFYTESKGRVSANGKPYEIAVKVDGPEDLSFSWKQVKGATGSSSFYVQDKEGNDLYDMKASKFIINPKLDLTHIELGVAAGKWTAQFTHNGTGTMSSSRSKHGIAFSKAYQINKDIEMTVSDDYFDADYRLIAVGKNGDIHTTNNRNSNSGGKVRQSTFKFKNLNLKDIKEFQFQTRPYEWVTFKNVSLKPGLETDVQVEVEKSDAKADAVNASHLKNVKFKIVDEAAGEPLRKRELNICQFVYFRLKPGAPSPYLDKGADFFITSIKTDGKGIFSLDLSQIDTMDIVVAPGKPYSIVRFSRSPDLSHTKSIDHIRIVQFKPGTTHVVSNMIYDLKHKIVKTIPTSGKPEEKPYEEIILVAKRAESSRNSVVQVEKAGLSFGPVIERVVMDDNKTANMFIDLDLGDLITPPYELHKLNSNKQLNWFAENGIDAGCETNKDVRGLFCIDMIAIPVSNAAWQNKSAESLFQDPILQQAKPGTGEFMSGKGKLPVTYKFKTREGGIGILEIGIIEEDACHIRYKMIQKANAQAQQPAKAKKEITIEGMLITGPENLLEKLGFQENPDKLAIELNNNQSDRLFEKLSDIPEAKMLAAPKIRVFDGHTGEISVSDKMENTTYSFKVTPYLKPAGKILLNITCSHEKADRPAADLSKSSITNLDTNTVVQENKDTLIPFEVFGEKIVFLLLKTNIIDVTERENGKNPAVQVEVITDKPPTALDLDSGKIKQLDNEWPDEYDVAWDNDQGGSLFCKRGGSVRILPILGTGDFEDVARSAFSKAVQTAEGEGRGVLAKDSRFVLVKTSEGNWAVVEILNYSPASAMLKWQIIKQNPAVQVEGEGDKYNLMATRGKSLLKAIDNDDIQAVQKLIEKHPELVNTRIDRKAKEADVYPLYYAISGKHKEIAKLLINKGADPDTMSKATYKVPLHYAVQYGYDDIITFFIKNGANPNGHVDSPSYAPIVGANARTAELLIELGADVNFTNKNHSTPLHDAAKFGNTEVAKVLLSHGVNINAKDDSGATPLHHAAVECRVEFVTLLLKHGADINIKNNKGRIPLKETIIKRTDSWGAIPEDLKFSETIKFLLSGGSDYTIEDVVWAADIQKTKKLLDDNPQLAHSQDHWRNPLLFCAIYTGNPQIVECLIQKGADIDQVGRYKEPSLHAAAYSGHKYVASLLLRKGVDVNRKGVHGELALHWAAAKGYYEILQLLIDAGAKVNTRTDTPRAGVDVLPASEYADVIQERLRFLAACEKQRQAVAAGSSLQIWAEGQLVFAGGDTALHSAAQWGHTEIVELLLSNGAKANATNKLGQTPLHYAVVFQHEEVVKALLNAGANPNIKMLDGSNAHDLASKVKDAELAYMLTREYNKVNTDVQVEDLPHGPVWTGVPYGWKREALWQNIATYLKAKIEKDLPEANIVMKEHGDITISYRTKEYTVERPTSKSGKRTETRKEIGPQPDGLIISIWLTDQTGQVARPQTLDRTYWHLYVTEVYLPELKTYLQANISYGEKTEKNLIRKYSDIASWLENIVTDKSLDLKADMQVEGEKRTTLGVTNKPWNVQTDLPPELLEKRNRLLAAADRKIRAGLIELSDKFPQLKKAKNWERVISGISDLERIGIHLFHSNQGKIKTTQQDIPEYDRYSVLVIVNEPPKEPTQLSMGPLYPNLGLVGQVNATAGDPELEAALKKLVDETLEPLDELEGREAKIKEHFLKYSIPLEVELATINNIDTYHRSQSKVVEARLKNTSGKTQIYPQGFGMTSMKWCCQVELITPDGRAWAAEARPFQQFCNYEDIEVKAGQSLAIGRWDLSQLEYNAGYVFRTIGDKKRIQFSEICVPGDYLVRWWDGIIQGRAPLVSRRVEFSIQDSRENSPDVQVEGTSGTGKQVAIGVECTFIKEPVGLAESLGVGEEEREKFIELSEKDKDRLFEKIEETADAKILSAPAVKVFDGKSGTIKVTGSKQFFTVEVCPQIYDEDTIFVELNCQSSKINKGEGDFRKTTKVILDTTIQVPEETDILIPVEPLDKPVLFILLQVEREGKN